MKITIGRLKRSMSIFLTAILLLGGFNVSAVAADTSDKPLAVDDTATTATNTAVTINVLENDSDPNGDTLTVVMLTSPSNGTAEINQDGTITYTPNTGYSGTDTFGYTVSDGKGGTSTATVAATIPTPENPPIVDSDALVQEFIRSIEPLTIGGELD